MTPEIMFQTDSNPPATGHLTEDQFGELLSAGADSFDPAMASAGAHLRTCEKCAAELAGLRESISLFRHASSTYANNELRQMPQVSLPARSVLSPAFTPAYFVAAAALMLAAMLPLQPMRPHTLGSAAAVSVNSSGSIVESDEDLLAGIDREISTSVPASMQALADPTGSTQYDSSASISVQRKD